MSPSRAQLQAQVAKDKLEHPERYCPEPRCLWRTGDGDYCPRHEDRGPRLRRTPARGVWGGGGREVERATRSASTVFVSTERQYSAQTSVRRSWPRDRSGCSCATTLSHSRHSPAGFSPTRSSSWSSGRPGRGRASSRTPLQALARAGVVALYALRAVLPPSRCSFLETGRHRAR